MTPEELRVKTEQLNERLIEVMIKFGEENPQIPAQILMAGLGQLLIQFSISQAGEAHTLLLIEELKGAVLRFGGRIAPQH